MFGFIKKALTVIGSALVGACAATAAFFLAPAGVVSVILPVIAGVVGFGIPCYCAYKLF